MYCRPPVEFETKEWTINNKTVLEIIVPKSKNRPHYAAHKDGKWLVYIRVADQNLLANRVLLKVWRNEGKPKGVFLKFTDTEKTLLEFLEKNPTITISRFCKIAKIPRQKAEDILVKFVLLKTVDIIFTEKQTFYSLKSRQE